MSEREVDLNACAFNVCTRCIMASRNGGLEVNSQQLTMKFHFNVHLASVSGAFDHISRVILGIGGPRTAQQHGELEHFHVGAN